MLLYCILGFVFISLLGTILHFVYDFFNHNKFAAIFVAVNESTWEHLKLAMLPTFLWAIVGLFFNFNNFAFAVFVALFVMVVTIPIIFYTYTHFTKKPILAVDILSFFVAIALGMLSTCSIMRANEFSPIFGIIGVVGTICFALSFFTFTIFPPHNFLFLDPITKKYGRAGHYNDEKFGNRYSLPKNK